MIRSGSVAALGAAINIELGFIPDYVKCVNITDGNQMDERWKGMAAASSIKTTNGAMASVGANALSDYAGDATHRAGFTMGTTIAVNAKTIYWIAVRNETGDGGQ